MLTAKVRAPRENSTVRPSFWLNSRAPSCANRGNGRTKTAIGQRDVIVGAPKGGADRSLAEDFACEAKRPDKAEQGIRGEDGTGAGGRILRPVPPVSQVFFHTV